MIAAREDIADLAILTIYLRWVVGTLNELRAGEQYSDQAFDKLKDLLLSLYLVCRHPSEEDAQRVREIAALPSFLGGFS